MLALIVRPATTARMVAKATAEMKAKNSSPPSALARMGATMLVFSLPSGVRIDSIGRTVAAPKPKKVVRM